MILPSPARAVPDTEQGTLSGASTLTAGPTTAVIYATYGYILVANRNSDTVSIFDLQTGAPIEDEMGNPWNMPVTEEPVAIAIREEPSALPFEPTEAYAFVAGYVGQAISIIDLTATPPVVLEDDEIDLTVMSESMSPGPVSLLVAGENLYVANADDGTIQRYDLSVFPPDPLAFGTADPSQTTANGNLVPCQVNMGSGDAVVTTSASPRVMLRYSGRNWYACDSGNPSIGASVGLFNSAGEIALRPDLAGAGNGLGTVRALAGDERAATDILYVLDDIDDFVVALDVAITMEEDVFVENDDPVIAPICAIGSTSQNGIPISRNAESTAMITVIDTSSTNGGDFLAVFSTSGAGTLDLINLAGINRDTMDLPECGSTADMSIIESVPLEIGNSNFPPSTQPDNIGQQIDQQGAYIVLPNFGASGGNDMVTLVTDAPELTPTSTATPALTNSASASPVAKTDAELIFDSSETIASSPEPTVRVRRKGDPTTTKTIGSPMDSVGDQLTLMLTSAELEGVGVVGASDNKELEVLIAAADGDGDTALVSRELVFDTNPPEISQSDPMNLEADVQVGSNKLRVTVPGAQDVPVDGVESGLGGFYIEFTDAVDADMMPVTPPPDQEFPASSATFEITGLTNRVTYTFNISAVDRAGNQSAEVVADVSGTPIPGDTLADLTGETGCVMSAHSRGANGAEWLLWIGVPALAFYRRGVRA